MNAKDSATHGAHEDERWREAKRRRIRELEADNARLRQTMGRCADKLEAFGNEEPLEVARVLRAA